MLWLKNKPSTAWQYTLEFELLRLNKTEFEIQRTGVKMIVSKF